MYRLNHLLMDSAICRRIASEVAARNSCSALVNAAGFSRFDKCAACGIITSLEPGALSWISLAIAGGVPGSWSPQITSIGVLISFSRAVRLIFGMAWQQPT